MEYSYLNHVETEFLEEEEHVGDEADRILKGFFQMRKGAQSRAFTGDSLRYFVLRDDEGVEIIEEDGDWESGEMDFSRGNDYELIYEENGMIRNEDLTEEEAEAYFL